MDNNKKIDDLEKQIKELKIMVANMQKKQTASDMTIRTLKRKVSDLEVNVDFLGKKR